MSKILVSDLYGTLIPEEIYNEKSKEFEGEKLTIKLISELDNFLSEDNYLYIVSGIEGHDPIYITFEQIVRNLFLHMDLSKLSKINFFFAGDIKLNDPNLYNMDKITTYDYENGLTKFKDKDSDSYAYVINKKSDIYPLIDKIHGLSKNKIYSLGNSSKDIDMVCESIKFNGDGAFIYDSKDFIYKKDRIYNLYRELITLIFLKNNNLTYSEFLESYDKLEDELYKCYGNYYIKKINLFLQKYTNEQICMINIFCYELSKYINICNKLTGELIKRDLPKEYEQISLYQNFKEFEDNIINSNDSQKNKKLQLNFMNDLIKLNSNLN